MSKEYCTPRNSFVAERERELPSTPKDSDAYWKQFRRGALAGTLLGALVGCVVGDDPVEWSQIGLPLGALVRTMPSMFTESN